MVHVIEGTHIVLTPVGTLSPPNRAAPWTPPLDRHSPRGTRHLLPSEQPACLVSRHNLDAREEKIEFNTLTKASKQREEAMKQPPFEVYENLYRFIWIQTFATAPSCAWAAASAQSGEVPQTYMAWKEPRLRLYSPVVLGSFPTHRCLG